jgi:hypothetical protein
VFYAESSRAAQSVGGKKKKEKNAEAALGGLQEQGHHEFCGPRKPFDDLAILLGNGSLALVQSKARVTQVKQVKRVRHTPVDDLATLLGNGSRALVQSKASKASKASTASKASKARLLRTSPCCSAAMCGVAVAFFFLTLHFYCYSIPLFLYGWQVKHRMCGVAVAWGLGFGVWGLGFRVAHYQQVVVA